MPDTYKDLEIVRLYYDEITTYIQAIIENENVAVILACQVFEGHKKREAASPFENEKDRVVWLYLCARNLAIDRLQHEKIKAAAVRKAIHDYP